VPATRRNATAQRAPPAALRRRLVQDDPPPHRAAVGVHVAGGAYPFIFSADLSAAWIPFSERILFTFDRCHGRRGRVRGAAGAAAAARETRPGIR
jgi:hypothetical protein